MIEAYEGVLLRNRRREREILNGVRHEEYERNRPPESKWYEFKHNGFNKELYRNRVALKPNNENKVYLERLQDKDIYWPFNNRLDNLSIKRSFSFLWSSFSSWRGTQRCRVCTRRLAIDRTASPHRQVRRFACPNLPVSVVPYLSPLQILSWSCVLSCR